MRAQLWVFLVPPQALSRVAPPGRLAFFKPNGTSLKSMDGYLILALAIGVAGATSFPSIPVRSYSQAQYQAGPLSYSNPRVAISGRHEIKENIHHESGNLYDGNRDGRFLTRDSQGDGYSDLQYSVRPQQQTPFRGQYQQQGGIRRFQEGDAYGYNPQINYNAPLANTRGYIPRLGATGNLQNEYRYY
ncbi:uncharacterized protein CDAR_496971 [Caerostris darwini]|uniref:Hymenoptaecin n=1 Tax=Caerostris darwini TaxID=1538125 RepID=A0AAV4S2T7_9ARAC|nr:uncharacterized protein CDAR_496971 [Caerostris darwini]